MKKISRKYFFIVIFLIIVFIILNSVPSLSSWLGNFIFKIFSPVQKFFIDMGNEVVGFFEILISIKDLATENENLRKENLELDAKISELKEVEVENENLRAVLEVSEKEGLSLDIAYISGKDLQGLQDWILIDKGSRDGIIENMAVISAEMALVGRVTEVMEDFSKVMLVTNTESVIAAIMESGRSEGLVKKQEKGKMFMDFIPRSEQLEIGERIITSGMDNIYPKGILIGKVQEIDFSQNQLFQKIYITPSVDFLKLEQVFVVK